MGLVMERRLVEALSHEPVQKPPMETDFEQICQAGGRAPKSLPSQDLKELARIIPQSVHPSKGRVLKEATALPRNCKRRANR